MTACCLNLINLSAPFIAHILLFQIGDVPQINPNGLHSKAKDSCALMHRHALCAWGAKLVHSYGLVSIRH